MRLLAVLASAALVLTAPRASAVALAFSSPGPGDVPGIVRVDMWFEDPTRAVEIYAIQFDIDLAGTSELSPGVQLPSVRRGDGYDWLAQFPFDLNQTIADPTGDDDVRILVASSREFDVDSYAGILDTNPDWVGAACAQQAAGLLRSRIFMGSFNLAYDSAPVFLKVPRTGSSVMLPALASSAAYSRS